MHAGPSGELVWEQVFGEANDDVAHAVRGTVNGGLIVTGYTRSFEAQKHDAWLIKIDNMGELEWQSMFGSAEDDRTITGEPTSDGGRLHARH